MKVYIVKSYLWQDNGIGELNDHIESIEAVCSSMKNAERIKEKDDSVCHDDFNFYSGLCLLLEAERRGGFFRY